VNESRAESNEHEVNKRQNDKQSQNEMEFKYKNGDIKLNKRLEGLE
jgi:DUF4097 and DUF4098 domain-containing protein YvlB